ncbi:hypothetical protein GALMADRAFT_147742 [Galerina marginata CBS 339.88]|uniref:DUF6533 domain-containing protein n=1 Tax=Galerina marginata (strain CBS 339.88) TaxID=685588 RepID=A0A067S764_GALM3|nr:hypothetical protein GALMADRAFT_147742 [Galerina marginata CBS 339.88]
MSQVTSPAALYSALVELAADNQTTNLSTVATLTWIVYDIILFFDQEVELIWNVSWKSPVCVDVRLLFTWFMHILVLEIHRCHALPALKVIGPMVLWITADIVWLIRLKALYGDKKQAFKWILLFWSIGATISFSFVTYAIFIASFIPAPPPFSSVTGCLVTNLSFHKLNNVKAAMISTMSIHGVFLALTLYKFHENHVGLGDIRFGVIMSAFIADGILYYVGLVVAVIFQLVTTSGGPSVYYRIADLSTYWLCGFYSLAGSHLILHLRAVNADPRGLSTVSHPLDFGHRTDMQRSDAESNAVEETQDGNYRNTGR